MIEFRCPSCQAPLRVPDSLAGKKGSCPTCKKVIDVPPAPSAPAGAPVLSAAAPPPQAMGGPRKTNGLGIASLVLGIASLVVALGGLALLFVALLSGLLAIAGLVLGIVGMVTADKRNQGRAAATAGLIISAISLLLHVVGIPLVLFYFMHSMSRWVDDSYRQIRDSNGPGPLDMRLGDWAALLRCEAARLAEAADTWLARLP